MKDDKLNQSLSNEIECKQMENNSYVFVVRSLVYAHAHIPILILWHSWKISKSSWNESLESNGKGFVVPSRHKRLYTYNYCDSFEIVCYCD